MSELKDNYGRDVTIGRLEYGPTRISYGVDLTCIQGKALAEARAEIERLRAALFDVASGRGMFGVDPAVDLDWAMRHCGAAALKGTEQ